ncbi:MAG: FtsW/RodA/SpoVE family cell cycle protein [bacterium]|nr:FtsW/RodA/SpoVE family cell cycle protein [bacterium]
MKIFRALRDADGVLLAAVLVTAAVGLAGLASLALRSSPPSFGTFTRQLIALGIGAVLFAVAAAIDWRAWERWWPVVLAVTAALLIGVLLFGARIRGTRGWLAIGPWTIQVVEFAKIGLILLHAVYFRRRARFLGRVRTVLESTAITAAFAGLVLLQPDLGSAMLLIVTWIGMLLVFGLRRAHLLIAVVLALLTAVLAWQFALAPYQRDRILTVLDPGRDPQGAGYNQHQAVIAIGAGGMFGQGFGRGTQSQLAFLPEAQSDFLPAVIGEEFGLLGMALLLAVVAVVLWRLVILTGRCHDDFSASIVVGMGFLFAFQSLYNVAMNMGVAPVMGIPFPFVSAGGSAVMAFAFGFGIITSIAMRTPRTTRSVYELHVIE